MEEQAIELWLSWIRSVPSLSEECLSLFERWFALVSADAQSGCSLSSQYLQLLESYILLGAESFLNRYHQPISHTLVHLLRKQHHHRPLTLNPHTLGLDRSTSARPLRLAAGLAVAGAGHGSAGHRTH